MTIKLFVRVLLANCLIIICFNLLLVLPELKVYLLAPGRRIFTGLALYLFQFFVTRFLLKNESFLLTIPFQGRFLIKGIVAFAIVILLTTVFVNVLDGDSHFVSKSHWGRFMVLFLFNSLPGALMEEWLFRYLPLRFVQSGDSKFPPNILFLLVLILFTLIHIPAYLLQYNADLKPLGNIFVSGIFLLLIYLMTKNMMFTALFHAFCNNPKFLMSSTVNWQYFYASVFLVTLAWPIVNEKIAQIEAKNNDHS